MKNAHFYVKKRHEVNVNITSLRTEIVFFSRCNKTATAHLHGFHFHAHRFRHRLKVCSFFLNFMLENCVCLFSMNIITTSRGNKKKQIYTKMLIFCTLKLWLMSFERWGHTWKRILCTITNDDRETAQYSVYQCKCYIYHCAAANPLAFFRINNSNNHKCAPNLNNNNPPSKKNVDGANCTEFGHFIAIEPICRPLKIATVHSSAAVWFRAPWNGIMNDFWPHNCDDLVERITRTNAGKMVNKKEPIMRDIIFERFGMAGKNRVKKKHTQHGWLAIPMNYHQQLVSLCVGGRACFNTSLGMFAQAQAHSHTHALHSHQIKNNRIMMTISSVWLCWWYFVCVRHFHKDRSLCDFSFCLLLATSSSKWKKDDFY